VLYPPNITLHCEGGVLTVSWTNNPMNAGRAQVNNYPISGYCSYGGAVQRIDLTSYPSFQRNEITARNITAGTECSFRGAARPYQRSTDDNYCYRLDLISWSPPQQCYITAAVSLEHVHYEVSENQSAVEVCITAEGFGVTLNLSTAGISAQAGEDYEEFSRQIAINSNSIRTCVSIVIVNNRAVEETVETFMVVLHSSDPYVTLNPGASNATVSIIDSSSKSVVVCTRIRQHDSVLCLEMGTKKFLNLP